MVQATITEKQRSRYDRKRYCLYVENIHGTAPWNRTRVGFRVGLIKDGAERWLGDMLTKSEAMLILRGALSILTT